MNWDNDITMCANTNCSLRENCWRFKATPNPFRQSYFMGNPNNKNQCDLYYPIEEELDDVLPNPND